MVNKTVGWKKNRELKMQAEYGVEVIQPWEGEEKLTENIQCLGSSFLKPTELSIGSSSCGISIGCTIPVHR